jgi:hypothetical protein
VAVRDFADQPFATWSATAQPCHLGAGAGFVDEDQAVRIKLGLILRPGGTRGGDIRPILLGRANAFF